MAKPDLFGNFKFRRLARALGGKAIAVGSLEVLWSACWDNLTDVVGTPEDVEAAAEWKGEAGVLFAALRDSVRPEGGAGFIEEVPDKPGVWRVHDMWHHAPEYVTRQLRRKMQREENGQTISTLRAEAGRKGGQARAANLKANGKQTADVCLANVATTVPSRPVPSHTETIVADEPPRPAADAAWDRVEAVWNRVCVPAGFAKTKGTARQRKLAQARCRDPSWLPALEAACAFFAREPFYRGENERGWAATLGWLMKPGKAEEIAERAETRRKHGRDARLEAAIAEAESGVEEGPAPDGDPSLNTGRCVEGGDRGREGGGLPADGVAADAAPLRAALGPLLGHRRTAG